MNGPASSTSTGAGRALDPAMVFPRDHRAAAAATLPAGGGPGPRAVPRGAGPGGQASSGATPPSAGDGTPEDTTPAGGASPAYADGTKTPPAGLAAVAAAMSEDRGPDSLDAHVRKLMKDLALWGYHVERSLDLDTGRTNVSRKGWPDWTILGPHGGLFRELKAENGKPSKEQRDVGARLRQAGFDWDIWKPSDLQSGRIQRELIAISRIGAAA